MNLFLPSDPRPVHFVGIAGAGMSALAALALRRGVAVTGSDLAPEGAPDLVGLGARVGRAPDAKAVDGARAVIVSAAIPADHEELVRAHQLGIPVVPRKQALAELVAGGRTVGIAGTHGKTTTTVMTTEALAAAGLEPTGLAGGRVASWGGNARVGSDRLFVVEADEYDRAFLELHPTVAVVNNVEPEHLECYGNSVEAMEDAFVTFAGRAETVLVGTEDPGAERVARRLRNRVWRFGSRGKDLAMETVMVSATESRAVLRLPDGRRANLTLRVPGFHNLWNATAALGVVVALEADVDAALSALAGFTGVGRRFERRGEAAGVAVVDDYAHHATELAATLAAGRQAFPKRRLIAVFQPHLYSRTAAQHGAMGRALAAADLAFVTEIYGAREAPIPGVSGAQVASAAGGVAVYEADRGRLLDRVAESVRPGDVVFTLGAGDITGLGPMLLARLEAR